jgi:glycosyltransferase involved in cell wall biosynthesis
MKNGAPKVSIIIPVYNVEPYLRRCLDSVIGQTLGDIEIICIDDASTDGSLAVLREYEAKDKRVKVIAVEKNGGVSSARNAGLKAARGEYVGFVDGDDYIAADFYEKLHEAAEKEDADIAKGLLRIVNYGGGEELVDDHEYIEQNKLNFQNSFTAAIYSSSFLSGHGLGFPAGIKNGEDTVFLNKAVFFANKVALTRGALYTYARREGSANEVNAEVNAAAALVLASILDWSDTTDMRDDDYLVIFHAFLMDAAGRMSRMGEEIAEEKRRAFENLLLIWNKCRCKDKYLSQDISWAAAFYARLRRALDAGDLEAAAALLPFFSNYKEREKMLKLLRRHMTKDAGKTQETK